MFRNTAFAILVSAVSSNAYAATYACGGHFETKGEIQVKITGKTLKATGSFTDEDGKEVEVSCVARQRPAGPRFGASKKAVYWDADEGCTFEYFRSFPDLAEKGEGMVSGANRSGGDNHDYSGYTYQFFFCK